MLDFILLSLFRCSGRFLWAMITCFWLHQCSAKSRFGYISISLQLLFKNNTKNCHFLIVRPLVRKVKNVRKKNPCVNGWWWAVLSVLNPNVQFYVYFFKERSVSLQLLKGAVDLCTGGTGGETHRASRLYPPRWWIDEVIWLIACYRQAEEHLENLWYSLVYSQLERDPTLVVYPIIVLTV